jgi:predicted transcriptional regulator
MIHPHTRFDEGYNHSYTSLVKTAISIPDALFQAADRLARHLGMTRSELYQRAVAAFLERHEAQAITGALDELYERQPDGGTLDRGIEILQTLSLPEGDW